MNGFAALAAKEAIVASGVGASLLPGIAPSAVDGFAAGTLLSGLCFLMVIAPKHGLRRGRLSARSGMLASVASAPVMSEYTMSATLSDPFADESAEVVVPGSAPVPDQASREPKAGAYRSKHRLADPEAARDRRPENRRPEIRRSAGRHAAPSSGIGSKVAGRLPFHPLAVRD
jgi:hypothetical protein